MIDELKKSGRWMVRFSYNGVGYDGHKHAPIGEWAECPRWTTAATCRGGGFFGQSLDAHGHPHSASDIEIAEHDGTVKIVGGDKIAVRRMRILARGQQAMDMLVELCDGVWPGAITVKKDITCALTSIGGNAYIYDGAPCPALTSIGGDAYILPGAQCPALTSIGGGAYIRPGAQCPALTSIGGYAHIYTACPALTTIGGYAYIRAACPALTTIGSYACIDAACPALTTIGGYAYIDAACPALTEVNGKPYRTGANRRTTK
jgi:hypothetical protein